MFFHARNFVRLVQRTFPPFAAAARRPPPAIPSLLLALDSQHLRPSCKLFPRAGEWLARHLRKARRRPEPSRHFRRVPTRPAATGSRPALPPAAPAPPLQLASYPDP